MGPLRWAGPRRAEVARSARVTYNEIVICNENDIKSNFCDVFIRIENNLYYFVNVN